MTMTAQPMVASSDSQEVEELTPGQLMQRQHSMLLYALRTGHPVIYQRHQQFVHTLRFQQSGGSVEADVYLVGMKDAVPPQELVLDPNYSRDYAFRK